MRKTDVSIFGDRAWMIAHIFDDDRVRVRLLAGPKDELRTQTVTASMLQGRPIYRQVSAIEDIDLDHAVDEVKEELDVSDLGDDPRKWVEVFSRIHGSRVTPDATILLGWFAAMLDAGRLAGHRVASPHAHAPKKAKRKPAPKNTVKKPAK